MKTNQQKSNYQTFSEAIDKAKNQTEISRLGKSLDRLYDNGIFTYREFGRLDVKIMERAAKLFCKETP